jgi:hypothetical protein
VWERSGSRKLESRYPKVMIMSRESIAKKGKKGRKEFK